jgi:hypothetical protein
MVRNWLRGWRLPLFLLITFRLSMLAFWPADQLTRWSGHDYFYQIASWVDQGLLPYFHYWVEYPPIFPFFSVLLYLLTPHYVAYVGALALVQLAFEGGILVLLYRLARLTLEEAGAERLVWAYTLLFAPVMAAWLNFDAIPTFFMLLAMDRWLAGRRTTSALLLGVGGLIKWFPLLLLAIAARFRRNWRETLAYGTIALALVALVIGLLAVVSPTYTLASLRSNASRTSWQTVWALLDGNLRTGAYHGSRLDPAAASLLQGNPPVVPGWVTLLLFGGLYLWLWLRTPGRAAPRRVFQFTSLTILVFFLWMRGWSPQWLTMLAPFLLLSLPLEQAAAYLVVITLINLAEWPLLISRGANQWLYLTTPLRTLLFIFLLVELARRCREEALETSPA